MAQRHIVKSLDDWTKSGTIEKALRELDNDFKHVYANTIMERLQTAWSLCLAKKFTDAMSDSSVVQDIVWEQLHCGDWKDVPVIWRTLYSHSSLLVSLCYISNGELTKAMLGLDKALLMGSPILDNYIEELAAHVSSEISCNETGGGVLAYDSANQKSLHLDEKVTHDDCLVKRLKLEISPVDKIRIPDKKMIERVKSPSLNDFLLNYMLKDQPAILTHCMDHWPACSKWSLDYLKKVAGPRTVPVELGSRYTDDNWSQQLMTIKMFIERHIENPVSGAPVGYLAQHTLFDQIPVLLKDIVIPDYCYLTTSGSDGADDSDVKINAWLGPTGTVSPLHHDPEHNLLSQVVGSKYIKLYSTDQTKYLYPFDGIMSNTSQVDAEHPNLKEFPQFARAVCSECTLLPGQMLYIPPKCWHFVRSLETSFSVSMWWS